MPVVRRPLQIQFDGFVVSQARWSDFRRAAGQANEVNLHFVDLFLALRKPSCSRRRAGFHRAICRVDRSRSGVRATADAPGVAVGILLRIRHFVRAERGMPRQRIIEPNPKNHVAALIAAVPDHIFPIFFMIVGLLLRPGLARRKVNCLRIRAPSQTHELLRSLT